MEHDFSAYTTLGVACKIMRLIALYVSVFFTCIQVFLLSVAPDFHIVTVCDVYLIIFFYLSLNLPTFINGVLVTDRRYILSDKLRTTLFWEVMTHFPFEVRGIC